MVAFRFWQERYRVERWGLSVEGWVSSRTPLGGTVSALHTYIKPGWRPKGEWGWRFNLIIAHCTTAVCTKHAPQDLVAYAYEEWFRAGGSLMARCVWCITLRPSSCVVCHPPRYVGVTNHTPQERAGCEAPHPRKGRVWHTRGRGWHTAPLGGVCAPHPGKDRGWRTTPREGHRMWHPKAPPLEDPPYNWNGAYVWTCDWLSCYAQYG